MKQKKELTAEGLMVQLAGHKNPNYFKNKIVFKIDNTNKHLLGVLHIVAPHIKIIDTNNMWWSSNYNVTIYTIPPIYLDSLVELYICNSKLTALPDILPKSLIEINCGNNAITQLPNTLPPQLKTLICQVNNISSLPTELPNTIKTLSCNVNLITELPPNLPKQLTYFNCSFNKLTAIDAPLPENLKELHVSYNKLTAINTSLPASLNHLDISNNNISFIGEKVLPASLLHLYVNNNNLSKLPDISLPNIEKINFNYNSNMHVLPDIYTLRDFYDFGCSYTTIDIYWFIRQFEKNYPKLNKWFTAYGGVYRVKNNTNINEYINECNSRRRTCERIAIINANGALWDAYMRRAMHPARFGAALLADPDLDIEEYTTSYVAAL